MSSSPSSPIAALLFYVVFVCCCVLQYSPVYVCCWLTVLLRWIAIQSFYFLVAVYLLFPMLSLSCSLPSFVLSFVFSNIMFDVLFWGWLQRIVLSYGVLLYFPCVWYVLVCLFRCGSLFSLIVYIAVHSQVYSLASVFHLNISHVSLVIPVFPGYRFSL